MRMNERDFANFVYQEDNKDWTPRSEISDKYCDWLLAKGYDPENKEEDDICWREYRAEKSKADDHSEIDYFELAKQIVYPLREVSE